MSVGRANSGTPRSRFDRVHVAIRIAMTAVPTDTFFATDHSDRSSALNPSSR